MLSIKYKRYMMYKSDIVEINATQRREIRAPMCQTRIKDSVQLVRIADKCNIGKLIAGDKKS